MSETSDGPALLIVKGSFAQLSTLPCHALLGQREHLREHRHGAWG